jgi:glutamate dehydrogenase (NAD(P)+)
MAWIMDTYSMHARQTTTAIVTGKPLDLGGSRGRVEATGRGVMLTAREAAKHKGIDLGEATVAVQGFGNVGSVSARLLAEQGCRIVAVSDVTGAIHDPDGIDVAALQSWVAETGRVAGFQGASEIPREDVLYVECDILIPAALESVIHEDNAEKIRARIVAEGANGPVTPEADKILVERGVLIVPDILCNAGGVTVSYFEWVQNRIGFYWEEEEVNQRMETILVRAFHGVLATALENEVSMRVAAFMLAIQRVLAVATTRGIYA